VFRAAGREGPTSFLSPAGALLGRGQMGQSPRPSTNRWDLIEVPEILGERVSWKEVGNRPASK